MFNFYNKNRMNFSLCINDAEIVSYYKSLDSDEARANALATSLKLSATQPGITNVLTQKGVLNNPANDP